MLYYYVGFTLALTFGLIMTRKVAYVFEQKKFFGPIFCVLLFIVFTFLRGKDII